MDTIEAKDILHEQLLRHRRLSQADLLYLLNAPETFEAKGPSGTVYGLEIEAFWDNEQARELRVIGCIDDGGWRAISPLSESFIIREDGSFVGE